MKEFKEDNMNTWTLWGLDVWGNPKDGFAVNDRWKLAEDVYIAEDATNDDIIRFLKRAGYLRKHVQHRYISIDGDDTLLFVDYTPTGEMLFQLEKL